MVFLLPMEFLPPFRYVSIVSDWLRENNISLEIYVWTDFYKIVFC